MSLTRRAHVPRRRQHGGAWTRSAAGGRHPVAEAYVDSTGSTKKGRARRERLVVVNENRAVPSLRVTGKVAGGEVLCGTEVVTVVSSKKRESETVMRLRRCAGLPNTR
jgi:cation transport ATPase